MLAEYRCLRTTDEKYELRKPSVVSESLQIDDETALWLMRMCVGEGGKKCSVNKASTMLWAMVNRWFLYPGRRNWPSFLFMVRRFSQPISPRWAKGGDLAHKFRNKPAGSPERLKRRAYISNLPKDKIPTRIKEVVHSFQLGMVPRSHDQVVTNWASLPSTPEKYPWGFDIEGDWFFRDPKLLPGEIFVIPMTPLVPVRGSERQHQ